MDTEQSRAFISQHESVASSLSTDLAPECSTTSLSNDLTHGVTTPADSTDSNIRRILRRRKMGKYIHFLVEFCDNSPNKWIVAKDLPPKTVADYYLKLQVRQRKRSLGKRKLFNQC